MSGPFVPFRQFVLKVHSRCDLACDHCYVYTHADQSWRNRPTVMSDETIAHTAARIAEHAESHALPSVRVIMHGGEPLLAGPARLERIATTLRAALDGGYELDLRIHTNGVLLDEAFCELFAARGIRVGISLDGDRAANDRHRRYADGRSSYDRVIRAIELLRGPRYRAIYAGLLCTIDVANDPIAVYESLVALDPPAIDFLLPHATWDQPPARPGGAATAYADWLIRIFDRWVTDGRPVPVRMFAAIFQTARGGASLTEALGLDPCDLIVIETDGALEQADSLKTAFEGAPATGLHVSTHSFADAASHPGVVDRQGGLATLCDTCQRCPVVGSCGGGLYAHRYRTGSGFANPSVYCADLLKLITHVRHRTTSAATGVAREHRTHTMPGRDLDDLAAGLGGAAAVGRLAESQLSVPRALLAALRADAVESGFAAAWDVLTRIDREASAALDAVLGHPYVRAWAVRCLAGATAAPADLGHVAAIAAAAAVRAGVAAEVVVPVRGGGVHLPTLGRFEVGPMETATVQAGGGTFDVRTPAGPLAAGPWQPVRRLAADGCTVALEDTDPYRDCHRWPCAPRLSQEQASCWQRMFRAAWELIQRDHSAYAPGLAAGLSTVTPLADPGREQEVSAAARDAFGAVGAALPQNAAALALLLIHEFQHVKLGAIFDLFDLYDETDRRLYHAPWRDDPRPLEALFQGAYAHLAVVDFWRVRRHTATGDVADAAAAKFVHWRELTAAAIETLAASGALTDLGDRFVARMHATIVPWLREPVPVAALRATARVTPAGWP
jgi:uncharacterized protein